VTGRFGDELVFAPAAMPAGLHVVSESMRRADRVSLRRVASSSIAATNAGR
jgi:hypothetical protein